MNYFSTFFFNCEGDLRINQTMKVEMFLFWYFFFFKSNISAVLKGCLILNCANKNYTIVSCKSRIKKDPLFKIILDYKSVYFQDGSHRPTF